VEDWHRANICAPEVWVLTVAWPAVGCRSLVGYR